MTEVPTVQARGPVPAKVERPCGRSRRQAYQEISASRLREVKIYPGVKRPCLKLSVPGAIVAPGCGGGSFGAGTGRSCFNVQLWPRLR